MKENTMHITNHDTLSASARWIVSARWYYAPLAMAFALLLGAESAKFVGVTLAPAALLIFVLPLNVVLSLFLKAFAKKEHAGEKVHRLNIAQIGLDLAFFFALALFLNGDTSSLAQTFFLVPIILAMLVFGFAGIMAVSVLSGLLFVVAMSVNADHGGFPLLELSLRSGAVFLTYILVGFFGGFFSRIMKRRDLLLLGEIAKGEEQVKRLEKLTDEFDQSAKLLVRRDLELTSANEQLKQFDRMKSEIISVVAHQLRTPLSGIKWTLKMLLDGDGGKLNKEQRGLLAKGFESNERMVALINDMLEVDHLESGKLKYNFVPVQFEPLIEEMIERLKPVVEHKKVRIAFLAPKQPLPKVKLDPEKIRDVLQNLLDNAVKYTKKGGLVTVGANEEEGGLHFWVEDDGIGIPDEAKDKIFSRFFRARNAIAAETDGSGLGLFIAQSVVKRHGGKIWFESTEGKGTTFHVLLPAM